jgi:4-amino-4-deoxy-L-arabinose transferase-like glycosyltransferase
LYGLSLVLLAMPFFASTGFFIIDEVVYVLSVQAFHAGQGLFVDNGYLGHPSADATMLGLLVATENGLAPQYPAGLAVLGSVFFEVLGARGLLLINALAAVGTLFVTHMLALRLFQSVAVANLAVALWAIFSFMPEYAVGFWPHMVSIFSVLSAFYLFLRAIDEERPFLWAAASGLVLGAGLLFRVDGILLLSTIAFVTVLYAQKPLVVFAGGLVGLAPIFVVMAWINSIKFGTLNPISYGQSGGGVDPARYISLAVIAGLATVAVWAIRSRGGLPDIVKRAPKATALVFCLLVLAAIFYVPTLQRVAEKLVRGVYVLVIDARWINDSRPGIWTGADSTLFLWGMTKKALGQSLPWLGLLAALFFVPTAKHRRSIVIVLLFAVLWSLPFILSSWHGGLGSNMRYFLPTVPLLSALCAWIILEIIARLENPVRPLVIGAAITLASTQAWVMFRESGAAGVQQVLSTYVLVAVVILACAGLLIERLRVLAGVAVGFGLAMSFANSVMDQSMAQARRAATHERAEAFAQMTGPILVYSAPETAVFADRQTDIISSIVPFDHEFADRDFVNSALSDGRRAFVPSVEFFQFSPWFEAVTPTPSDVPDRFFEIVAR